MARPTLAQLTAKPGPAAKGASGLGDLKPLGDLTAKPGPVQPKKGGGHGFWGTLARVPGDTASGLAHIAVNVPAGLAQAYEAEASAISSTIHHPFVSREKGLEMWRHPLRPVEGTANTPQATALAKGYLQGLEQTVQHPLRDPALTLLNLLPVASGAARVGLRGVAGRTLVDPQTGLAVHPELSRSGLGQATQLAADASLQRLARRKPGGLAEGRLQKKIGKVTQAEARQASQIAAAPGKALIKIGSRLKPAEQKALQVVAEQAPIEGRITAASARVIGARDAVARGRHQAELDLLHQAKPLLSVVRGKPSLASARLQKIYDRMAKVAGDRETLLQGLGELSGEATASRLTKAGRVALGAESREVFLPASTADLEVGATVRVAGQKALGKVADRSGSRATVFYPRFGRSVKVSIARLEVQGKPQIQGAEDFAAGPEAVRIPDVATRRGTRSFGAQARVGGQGTIGELRTPGSLTHEYTGALRSQAHRRQDTTRLVGEASLEAAKFAGLKHIQDLVRPIASAAPARADDIAVRLDSGTMPLAVRQFLDDPEQFHAHRSPLEAARKLDEVRQRLFVAGKDEGGGWKPGLSGEARAEFERLHAAGKIGWVPKRILGELANPSAPLRAVAPGRAVSVWDAINNASRFAILYLKPAYAIPNILGNAALNIIQQGFAAPRNLAQAARLVQRLSDDDYATLDAIGGEGLARAISAHGQGPLARGVDFAAQAWSNVVDLPFRRAAILHEIRRSGHKTPAQIHALLARDAHDPELLRIGIRANRDIIDYGNLSNVEREVIRRVVFFYPWVKGSTVYAGRFLREHPGQAAAAGSLGTQGEQFSQGRLGLGPSYLEGLIPVGSKRAINPAAAALFQTPAQLVEAGQGLLSGHIPAAAQLQNVMTPALLALLAEITRRKSTGVPYPPNTPGASILADTLVGGLPQASLYRNVSGRSRSKLYPPSVVGGLGRFLVGGVYPSELNRAEYVRQGRSERRRLKTGY